MQPQNQRTAFGLAPAVPQQFGKNWIDARTARIRLLVRKLGDVPQLKAQLGEILARCDHRRKYPIAFSRDYMPAVKHTSLREQEDPSFVCPKSFRKRSGELVRDEDGTTISPCSHVMAQGTRLAEDGCIHLPWLPYRFPHF